MLNDDDLNLPEPTSTGAPRRAGNRFMVTIATLGGIILLALVAIAVYALVILPRQQVAPPQVSADQQTGTALALAIQATDTPTSTASSTPTRTNTPRPTNTPLITDTPDPATQTVNALLTQAALAQTQAVTPTGPTSTPGTPTSTPSALPSSGFADEVGAPGLLAAAAVLIAVVILARRLRNAD
jgi:hypothetical protein